MTPSAKKTKKSSVRQAGAIVLGTVALLALLMILRPTREFMIALFGWAVCAYIPALFVLGVLGIFGKKPKAGRFRLLSYVLSFAGIVCTLHIWLAKSLIESGDNYITAPFKGVDTVGGAAASVLSAPFVLSFKDFGLSLALSFLVTAGFVFWAIYPFILKIKDRPARKKKEPEAPKITANPLPKEKTLFVSNIEDTAPQTPADEAASRIFAPKEPYDAAKETLFSSLLSPDELHKRKAKDSSRILFGNEEPPKEEKPRLKVLGDAGRNYFAAKAENEARDKMRKAFGDYDYRAEYINRYAGEEPKGRELESYPEPAPAVTEPLSPRLDGEPKRQAAPPPPPKPKKVIANPREYIKTPIGPEEFLSMMGEDTSIYNIPQDAAQTPPQPQYPGRAEYPQRTEYPQRAEYPQREEYQAPDINVNPVPNFYGSDIPAPYNPVPTGRAPETPAAYTSKPAYPEYTQPRAETPYTPPRVEPAAYTPQAPVPPVYTPPRTEAPAYTPKPRYTPEPERKGFNVKQEVVAPPAKPVQQSLFESGSDKVYIPKKYDAPPLNLLKQYTANGGDFPEDFTVYKAKMEQTMEEFSIPAVVTDAKRGPTFTRYELKLGPGCNIKKVANLQENLTMRLEVKSIRILAPIEGKNAFGIEIPNKVRDIVGLRSILASQKFMATDEGVQIAMGKTLEGEPYVADLASMPHLLVAGATGTGKSVFINQIIMSILFKYSPEDVRLILIDPKKVELSVYQNLPNLLIRETVKEAAHAVNLLNRLTKIMDDRFSFLEKHGAVDIDHYNNEIRDKAREPKMFRIVIVVDEMADLMMKGRGQVEEPIVRIAQLGRACGIHLVLATQRPTVNVITGLIKGNILARVAFAVKTAMDSRIILDEVGAENLLGKGDMIFSFKDISLRLQGSLVEPEDIKKVCNYIKDKNETDFDEKLAEQIKSEPGQGADAAESSAPSAPADKDSDFEQLLRKILKTFILERKASVSMAQTKHNVGYIKARKLIDAMTDRGFISAEDGAKPREVLITMEEYNELFGEE